MSNGYGCADREPDFIYAGTTVYFHRCFANYSPANGWIIQYSIVGEGIKLTFESVPDQQNSGFIMIVPASTTATWIPNDAAILTGYAILAANYNNNGLPQIVKPVYQQQCPIKPNLVNPAADQPFLTNTQKAITALWALYLNKANDDLLIAHVGDSSFRFESRKEILDQIYILEAHRRVEVDRERAANGKPSRRRMAPRIGITPQGPLLGRQWPYGYSGN